MSEEIKKDAVTQDAISSLPADRCDEHNNFVKAKLLVVDDDEGVLKQLKWAFGDEYEVLLASNREDAFNLINEHSPELIALDMNLDGNNLNSKDGIDILDEIKNKNPFTKVIMVTGNDSKENALESIAKGAFDYYLKPVNVDELKIIFKRALYILNLEKDNRKLSNKLNNEFKFEDIVGSSQEMRKVFNLIKRVSSSDVTVLVTGESGTGKELVAKAIHYSSLRKNQPFVVINCGAIPENLLESELFGHEKGAFTDAYIKRVGKFEVANKGTIFLDEIGDMSLSLQVKLLRFLQERVIERVGGNSSIEVDVRIVAATNCDLRKKIEESLFREDLFFRLSVINIDLPALRERGEDKLILANYFLNKYKNDVVNKNVKGFTKDAKTAIKRFGWQGNVREMENRVRRALILSEDSFITPSDLGFTGNENFIDIDFGKLSLKEAKEEIESKYIKKALEDCKGNISSAAKMLGVTRPTLYDLIKKYNLGIE
ncbi:MAG: PEP-CTERM-box response regulator transcription factor [Candidatus Omnitrophica bacterium]|nr:PEP-CTERM-box response regulator transcription factor [Candidatus Omnitrophota bacterium]